MKASLVLETEQYQVFDLGYGATIVNKTPVFENYNKSAENVELFPNVFFQGDDYVDFMKEVENIEKKNLSSDKANYVLDQYSLIMSDLTTQKDFDNIGIVVRSNLKV